MKRRAPREGRGLSSLAITRPVGTMMLTAVAVVLGGFFLSGLPLDLLPSIVYPQIRANVNNRGVSPDVLEETVAKPLEAALSTTEDLTRIETQIQEGQVGVSLHFSYGGALARAFQISFPLLQSDAVEVAVLLTNGRFSLLGFRQLLRPILAQQFVELVTAVLPPTLQQRLTHQPGQLPQIRACHSLGCLPGKTTAKHRQLSKNILLLLSQLLPGIINRRPNTAMTLGYVLRVRFQEIQPLLKFGRNLGQG